MSKPKTSRSFILQQRASPILYSDQNQPASDNEEQNSLFDDHRVPHFGGQQEEQASSDEELEDQMDNTDSEEEDEADLLSELRQLSKNMTKGISGVGKKQLNKGKVEDLMADLDPPKKSVKEFDDYYQKSFKRFLSKKESDLEKLRRQKEETEAMELKNKPDLVAKQQRKKHIPIANRVEIIQAKKERELMKLKKQQEEKLEKEMSELTFAPKINHNYVADHLVIKKREGSPPNKKYQSNKEVLEINEVQEKVNNKGKNSKITSGVVTKSMTENNQKEIIDKLYANTQATQPAVANKSRKHDINSQAIPNVNVQNNRASNKAVKSNNELTDIIRQPEKRISQVPVRTDDAIENRKVTPLKNNRDPPSEPSKDLDTRAYRSHGRPERTSDFMSEQEAVVQKLNDIAKANPQKHTHTTPEMLESLLKYYSEQRSHGSHSDRQNRQTHSTSLSKEEPREKTPVKGDKKDMIEKESPQKMSLSPERANRGMKMMVTPPRSQKNEVIEEEVIEEQEESEMASIKQNLLSIQDNIQTLKQSFKNFQDAQAVAKVDTVPAPAVETPRKGKQVTVNMNQQVSQQGSDKKVNPKTNNDTQAVKVKKESVAAVDSRSKTPPPNPSAVTAMKKSPSGDNRTKQVSPTPAQKGKNSQIIKITSESSGYAKRAARPVQEPQVVKVEEKKENYSSVGAITEKNTMEIEHLSLGNVSFAANRASGEGEKKVIEVKDDKLARKEEIYRRDVVGSQQGGLEAANLLLKAKTGDNTQSLKDIAQMTLMKFKGLGQKTNGSAEGYASLKRVNK